jgi:flagellar basal-body rod modification protein FlgD
MSTVSNYFTSLSSSNSTSSTSGLTTQTTGQSYLDVDDFFQLLAAELQNQDMSNPVDSSDFMNQLALVSTMQAMQEITDVSVVSYAASLVGKDVTIGQTDSSGNITEIYGTVTATGVYSGEQVIFVDGTSYTLSSIMAIGKLPETDSSGTED